MIQAPDFPYDFRWVQSPQPLSLFDDLQGFVVLVHFWTSSNVHCHHVFNTLAYLEQRFAERAFTCVGVHTGKFSAERDGDHVEAMARRFGLRHPIVVDEAGEIWKSFESRGWPFVALLNGTGGIAFRGAGEPDRERLVDAIEFLLDEAAAEGIEPYVDPPRAEPESLDGLEGLRFPTAVDCGGEDGLVWVVDSGRHRIVGMAPSGDVECVVGSGEPGAADGAFDVATFFQPQSILVDGDTIWVADAGNHLIRRIDRQEGRVDTVLGTNRPVVDGHGGGSGPAQPINSPWGLALVEDRLFVSMAGSHQIWVVQTETMTALPFVGAGHAGCLDGPVYEAVLAQPAALARQGERIAFVDSDSSSLRVLGADSGEVESLVSGGLFKWGDADGDAPRLQFPRGLTWYGQSLLIADTFNDRIRRYEDGKLTTLPIDVHRPEGLTWVGEDLYVADTGNHRVLRVKLPPPSAAIGDDLVVEELTPRALRVAPTSFGSASRRAAPITLPPLFDTTLRLPVELPEGTSLQYDTRPALLAENLEGHALVVDVTLHLDLDGEWFIARGVGTGDEGEGVLALQLVYTTCLGQNQVCHVHERRLEVPITIRAGAEPDATIRWEASAPAADA